MFVLFVAEVEVKRQIDSPGFSPGMDAKFPILLLVLEKNIPKDHPGQSIWRLISKSGSPAELGRVKKNHNNLDIKNTILNNK